MYKKPPQHRLLKTSRIKIEHVFFNNYYLKHENHNINNIHTQIYNVCLLAICFFVDI
jgi:hypothetical protein